MVAVQEPRPMNLRNRFFAAFAIVMAAAGVIAIGQQPGEVSVLRIGTSGSLSGETMVDEESATKTLKELVKSETGFNNEIFRQESWRELADKLAVGEVHIGVFLGPEFAWAKDKQAGLKPLSLAVNVYPYPVVYVVGRKEDKMTSFKDLKGKTIAVPGNPRDYLRLYVENQAELHGQKADQFFTKIATPKNLEDAIDDVVDGAVQAVAVHRPGLEAYKRRKPGRFNKLQEIMHSDPLLPPTIAYHEKSGLSEAALQRLGSGLQNSGKHEKGKALLTFFRLTGFEPPPADFDKVLSDTRKMFPPPDGGGR